MTEKELLLRTPEYLAAIQEAVALLKWWQDDVSDEPDVLLMIERSRVTAAKLQKLAEWLGVPASADVSDPKFRRRLQRREAKRRQAARERGHDVPKRPPHWTTRTRPFWSYVTKARGDECWEWTGNKRRGYGDYKHKGTRCAAHIWSWQEATGRVLPRGMVIMHKCDNRACVRPDHLKLGTYAENNHDKTLKGRQAKGATNASSKLTAEQVAILRAQRPRGKVLRALATSWGVSSTALYDVLRGKNWRHV